MDIKSRIATALAALILVFLVVGLIQAGAQAPTILSKVGSSVSGDSTYTGGSSDGASDGQNDSSGGEPERAAANGGAAQVAALRPLSLLVVHTGTLTVEVASVGESESTASGIVARAGGFVAGSTEAGTGSAANAVVSYRIPAGAWESTLAAIRAVGTVRGQEIKADEVTGTVLDLGARIANLRATEAALLAIMAKATRIQDVLDVQKQLTDTRGQIEQLATKKAGLENQAAFGSLTVTFRLPAPAPTPRATPRPATWDPAADAQAATAKLVRIGQKAGTAGIWLAIVGLPLLVALTVALGIGWGLYRLASRLTRRREAAG